MATNPVDTTGPIEGRGRSVQETKTRKRDKPVVNPDVFTTLLFVSAAALCAAGAFFVLVMNEYGWKMGP